jgi:hypothetical protein
MHRAHQSQPVQKCAPVSDSLELACNTQDSAITLASCIENVSERGEKKPGGEGGCVVADKPCGAMPLAINAVRTIRSMHIDGTYSSDKARRRQPNNLFFAHESDLNRSQASPCPWPLRPGRLRTALPVRTAAGRGTWRTPFLL